MIVTMKRTEQKNGGTLVEKHEWIVKDQWLSELGFRSCGMFLAEGQAFL